jgi:hypothetical protein
LRVGIGTGASMDGGGGGGGGEPLGCFIITIDSDLPN